MVTMLQNAPLPPRHFSTAARVYPAPPKFHTSRPPTTPNIPKAGGRAGKLYLPFPHSSYPKPILNSHANTPLSIVPAVSLVVLGVLSTTPLSPLRGSPSPAESEQSARNAALMDAYGDRMNLADMEKALEAYEVR